LTAAQSYQRQSSAARPQGWSNAAGEESLRGLVSCNDSLDVRLEDVRTAHGTVPGGDGELRARRADLRTRPADEILMACRALEGVAASCPPVAYRHCCERAQKHRQAGSKQYRLKRLRPTQALTDTNQDCSQQQAAETDREEDTLPATANGSMIPLSEQREIRSAQRAQRRFVASIRRWWHEEVAWRTSNGY